MKRISRYKLWFNKGWHCCGIKLFGIPIVGVVGRKKKFKDCFLGLEHGGFRNYWIWRITLTIFN